MSKIWKAAALSLWCMAGHAWAQTSEACRPLEAPAPVAVRAGGAGQDWARANGRARQRPDSEGFEAARYVYTYAPGALYELYANPAFISTILLEEGEALVDVAAGDTARWMVTQTTSQGDWAPRTLVLVKPQAPGLRTNIVLVTDRRTYMVEAVSHAREAYSAQIAWCYLQGGALAATRAALSDLNFAYHVRVVRGRRPPWTPARVFDDGARTWIEFDPSVEAGDLPPLFVVTPESAELTNYRFDGRRYMIDRVFERAELRLGLGAPTIVRIERDGASPLSPPRRRRS